MRVLAISSDTVDLFKLFFERLSSFNSMENIHASNSSNKIVGIFEYFRVEDLTDSDWTIITNTVNRINVGESLLLIFKENNSKIKIGWSIEGKPLKDYFVDMREKVLTSIDFLNTNIV